MLKNPKELKKRKKDTKIIEFFGIPGSGKTILSKEVSDYLKKKGYFSLHSREAMFCGLDQFFKKSKDKDKTSKLIKKTRYLPFLYKRLLKIIEHSYRIDLISVFEIENPELCNKIFNDIKTLLSDKEGKRMLKYAKGQYNESQNMKEINSDFIIMEAGFCQTGFLLYSKDFSKKEVRNKLKKYLDLVCDKFDCAFFIETDPREATKRIEKDSSGRVKEERKNIINDYVASKHTVDIFNEMIKILKKKGKKVYKINNQSNLISGRQKIREKLNKIKLENADKK